MMLIIFSRKLVKRIEDLLRETSALKSKLLPQLNNLTILVSKGVDFAIQVRCQLVMCLQINI